MYLDKVKDTRSFMRQLIIYMYFMRKIKKKKKNQKKKYVGP